MHRIVSTSLPGELAKPPELFMTVLLSDSYKITIRLRMEFTIQTCRFRISMLLGKGWIGLYPLWIRGGGGFQKAFCVALKKGRFFHNPKLAACFMHGTVSLFFFRRSVSCIAEIMYCQTKLKKKIPWRGTSPFPLWPHLGTIIVIGNISMLLAEHFHFLRKLIPRLFTLRNITNFCNEFTSILNNL